MDTAKLDKYVRANGGLNLKQTLIFTYWSFFNFKKCCHFYHLCESGDQNFTAFNKAHRASNKETIEYLLQIGGSSECCWFIFKNHIFQSIFNCFFL